MTHLSFASFQQDLEGLLSEERPQVCTREKEGYDRFNSRTSTEVLSLSCLSC